MPLQPPTPLLERFDGGLQLWALPPRRPGGLTLIAEISRALAERLGPRVLDAGPFETLSWWWRNARKQLGPGRLRARIRVEELDATLEALCDALGAEPPPWMKREEDPLWLAARHRHPEPLWRSPYGEMRICLEGVDEATQTCQLAARLEVKLLQLEERAHVTLPLGCPLIELPTEAQRPAARRLCEVVAEGHARGFIFGPIEARRAWVSREGDVTILFPELSQRAHQAADSAGCRLGLKPRLCRGNPERYRHAPEGPWTDIFHLGWALYTILSGRSPFPEDKPYRAILAIRAGRVAPLGPGRLEALTLRCFDPEPERRPSIEALIEALS